MNLVKIHTDVNIICMRCLIPDIGHCLRCDEDETAEPTDLKLTVKIRAAVLRAAENHRKKEWCRGEMGG